MAQIDGYPAGAIAPQQPEETQQGIPPHWNVYITVDDVDAVAERVPELGGNVLMAPMDVFDAGRMIVAQDSVGAVVMFWQPNQHIGAEVRDEHGALTWTLVMTTDKNATADFYSQLLDIEVARDSMPSPDGSTVHQLIVDGMPVASIMDMPQNLTDMGVPSSLGGLLQSQRRAGSLRRRNRERRTGIHGTSRLGPHGNDRLHAGSARRTIRSTVPASRIAEQQKEHLN